MKQNKPPALPATAKAKDTRSGPPPYSGSAPRLKTRGTGKPGPAEIPPEKPAPFGWQLILLAGLVLIVLAGFLVSVLNQPQPRPDREELQSAVETALVATGRTPLPTLVPGSDLGIDLVLFKGNREVIPALPDEKVNFFIINTRQKSVFLSNCDGVILQRFLGRDPKNSAETVKIDNWESIAPGGFPYCGPLGREAIQVAPGARADASFKFDIKATRPFNGKSWNVTGTYRFLVQFYLQCPNASLKIEDCQDKRVAESEYFNITALPAGVTPVITPGAPTGTLTPTARP